MDHLNPIFSTLKLSGGMFARCQYRGDWALDMLSDDAHMLFHVVQTGSAEFQYLDAEQPPLSLSQGDIVLLPFGNRHRLWQGASPPSTPPLTLCGYYRGGHTARHPLLKLLPPLIHIRAGHETTLMIQLLQLIDTESAVLAAGSRLILDRLAEALLLYLLRAWTQQQEQPSGLLAALADPRLSCALAALHERPEQDWTVAKLAKLAGASRAGFAKRFQTLLGCGPFQYLTELRMNQAMRWLRDDKLPLAKVAEGVGYSSEAAFARVFKKQVGVSPGRFRAQQ